MRDHTHLHFLGAIDCGFQNSYTAPTWLAEDRKAQRAWIFDGMQVRGKTPAECAPIMKKWDKPLGLEVPFAWPMDVKHHMKSGEVALRLFERAGVNMLPVPAAFDDGRHTSVEEGVTELFMAFKTGQLKIADGPHTREILRQMGLYSRDEDGNFKKSRAEQFDLLDSMRYLWVMALQGFAQQAQFRRREKKMTIPQAMYGIH